MAANSAPEVFDVVVLGGGAAGCVLAARLSEEPGRRIGLVEAGPDYGPDPRRWPSTILDAHRLPRDHVWESRVATYRFRAKILGGSSGINGCWHTWGCPADFAGWERRGGPAWSQKALEPFRQLAAEQMGLRPPLPQELSAWNVAAGRAAAQAGFPRVDTACPSSGHGYGVPLLNEFDGVRWNAALAYLGPARDRPNLTILDRTMVDRLVLRRGQVTGVEIVRDGRRQTLRAGEYVLASGAFGSPAVLLRSGVGPAAQLQEIGVSVAVDLPGVGENLADQPGVFVPMAATPQLNASLAARDAADQLYASRLLIRAAGPYCDEGDWDLHILPTAGAPLFGTLAPGQYEAGISAFVMKPASRGRVRLAAPDPEAPAQIDPGFLSDPEGRDLATMRAGLRLAEQLTAASPLSDLATPIGGPLADLADGELRGRTSCYWHPVGTCAFGPDTDPLAVVAADARVHGIDNLRIVDASILPEPPAANTQLSVLAVAEMLAASMRE